MYNNDLSKSVRMLKNKAETYAEIKWTMRKDWSVRKAKGRLLRMLSQYPLEMTCKTQAKE
jgi:hypothetical protein